MVNLEQNNPRKWMDRIRRIESLRGEGVKPPLFEHFRYPFNSRTNQLIHDEGEKTPSDEYGFLEVYYGCDYSGSSPYSVDVITESHDVAGALLDVFGPVNIDNEGIRIKVNDGSVIDSDQKKRERLMTFVDLSLSVVERMLPEKNKTTGNLPPLSQN